MEDALVQRTTTFQFLYLCLNPCFNGRCTSTYTRLTLSLNKPVLILVLMEDALVQQNYGNALFKCIVRLNCASKGLVLTNFMYLFSECKGITFYRNAQNYYVKITRKRVKYQWSKSCLKLLFTDTSLRFCSNKTVTQKQKGVYKLLSNLNHRHTLAQKQRL